jgi:hypothetical protein
MDMEGGGGGEAEGGAEGVGEYSIKSNIYKKVNLYTLREERQTSKLVFYPTAATVSRLRYFF